MTNELGALERKIAGFETSISELMRAQTVQNPLPSIPGVPKNSLMEEWNIEVDVEIHKYARPRSFL